MAKKQLTRITPRAEAIMDWLLANPAKNYKECANALEVSENWISIVMNSEIFQVEYRRRQAALRERLEGQILAVAGKALDRVEEELGRSEDPYYALQVARLLVPQVLPPKREVAVTVEPKVGSVSPEILREARARMKELCNRPVERIRDVN